MSKDKDTPTAKIVSFLTKITPISTLLALTLLVVLPSIGFYIGTKYQESLCPRPITWNEKTSANQENRPNAQVIFVTKNIISETFPNDWKQFNSPGMKFSIKHPVNVNVNSGEKNELYITYKGKYQDNNQAWVDGIIMKISYHELNQENLQNIVVREYTNQHGTPPTEMKEVIVGNTKGYQIGSLESNHSENISDLYLYVNDSSYLKIFIDIMDFKNEGYSSLAKQLLSSLEVTK